MQTADSEIPGNVQGLSVDPEDQPWSAYQQMRCSKKVVHSFF